MTKKDLINQLSAHLEMPKSTANTVLNAAIDIIKDAVLAGETVQIKEFATFSLKERAERQGRNPQTGEAITIPAHTKPFCKLAKW